MLDSPVVCVVVGCCLGFLSGIGVGGGSLLMLWLTAVLRIPAYTARTVNLLFFLPGALVACLFRQKQGILDLRTILPAVLAGCIGAATGSWLGTFLETGLLKKLFGGLLILTGVRELTFRTRGS